jgi:cell pole-organizing protein PopZ
MAARDQNNPPDPSMEDILASIRDILNEDEKTVPEAPLELTEAMLLPNAPLQPVTASPPDVIAIQQSPPPTEPPAPQALQALLAPAAAAATAAALGELARAVSGDRSAPVTRGGGASIEDVVREELRPLLKSWLDQHLPGMVEQIVKAEIARLMGPPRA